MRWLRWTIVFLLGAAAAFGGRLSFQEHAAVQESLSRVHPRMRASWLRAHGLDDSYYTTFRRPESTGLACIGRWPWGPSWELAGRDTFMYLGSGSGVRILSIADSVHPRMRGQINARGLVSQVVVQDSLLFVACGSWGAQIYSVSNPANPRELGSMDAVIGDLCVQDTFCYTVGDSFRIYNCADPTQPAQVAAVSDSGDVIAEANGYAYVGHGSAGSGLNVYDARNPHSPTLVNTLGGVQLAMFTRGHWLFRISEQPAYFSMLDVSNPASPVEVGRLNGYGGVAMYADDKYAYLSGPYEHSGLFVVDISDSSHPQLRDSINPVGMAEWDPFVPHSPGYGYLADDYGGLVVLDLHDVNNISQSWSGYRADRSVDIAVDNGRAYLANSWVGTQIVDVTDPTKPASIGVYDTSDSRGTNAVAARDSFAFVGMSGAYGQRSLRVLDVNDPSKPRLVAEDSCHGWPQDFVLRDSLLYATEPYQFQVFNVARPREPVRVGSCGGVGINTRNIALNDSTAYVAMGSGGLACIDISNPAAPSIIGSWGGRSSGVSLSDTVAYVAGPYTGLVSLSVTDPSSPRVIDSLYLSDTLWWNDVLVSGSRAYVGGERVLTVDIADPANLVVRGTVSPPHLVQRLAYSSPYLYAACLEAGVAIYETTAVGIAEQAPAGHGPATLRLRPGLTEGEVHFTLDVAARSIEIAVYDVSGKRLGNVRQQVTMKGDAAEGLIDLSGLAAGVYVVKVEAERKSFTAKVVKTNRR
jgi:hypothetical protein